MFDSFANTTLQNFNTGYQKLLANHDLSELSLSQLAIISPQGKAFAVSFLWSSDDEEKGQRYLARIEKFGTIVMNSVVPTTVSQYLDTMALFVPSKAHGTVSSINVHEMTAEIIEVIAINLQQMPSSSGTALVINELRGPSATPKDNSIFASREPHFIIEFFATTAKEEDAKEGKLWIDKFRKEIQGTSSQNIMTSSYLSCKKHQENSISILAYFV